MEYKTVVELKSIARSKGLKGYSRLRKKELLELLQTPLSIDTPANLPELPLEIWDLILRMSETPSRGRMAQTCHLFYELAQSVPKVPEFLYNLVNWYFRSRHAVHKYFFGVRDAILELGKMGHIGKYERETLPKGLQHTPIEEIPHEYLLKLWTYMEKESHDVPYCCDKDKLEGLPWSKIYYYDSYTERYFLHEVEALREAIYYRLHKWIKTGFTNLGLPTTREEVGLLGEETLRTYPLKKHWFPIKIKVH